MQNTQTSNRTSSPAKVLLVEDDPAVRRSVSRLLTNQQFAVCCAQCGEDALQCFENFKPDIVLTDIQMPGMSGLELAGVIKKRAADVKIIFMTAGFNCDDRCELKYRTNFSCDQNCKLLLKPFKCKLLIQLIDFMLADKPNNLQN